MPILSKLQVLIHPVFALLTSNFDPQPNDEVQRCFWVPLALFLMEQNHEIVIVGSTFRMHRFEVRTCYIPFSNPCLVPLVGHSLWTDSPFVHFDIDVSV